MEYSNSSSGRRFDDQPHSPESRKERLPENFYGTDPDPQYYDDASSHDEMLAGVAKVEAVQAVWGPVSKWFLFGGIALSSYIYSLDGVTTWQYLSYATSSVLKHSVSGTISTANAIIIAVGKPLMAKLADVVGRAETFVIVTILYVVGYIVIATANDVNQIAGGQIIYSFGYTGLQMLQQIVIADMTNLRWRGLVTGLVSAPFIINNFVSAEIAQGILPNWRWGYAMFAILVPVSLAPIIVTLFWAQWKARKMSHNKAAPKAHKRWNAVIVEAALEMDLAGLVLIAASLALILLPLGLAPAAKGQWHNPSMIGMVTVGAILFPIMLVFEWKVPRKPVVPMRWLRRGPILGACLIGFSDFVSFYLQYTYLYSYVYVTENWSYRNLTYFSATQSLALTVFGILGGLLMYITRRFKWMLFGGLLVRLLGCGLMLKARSASGNTAELVMCQVLQGLGGGFAAIAIQVSAQAAVVHVDVATVTAMVLLITEVGNSVGSAIAAEIWSSHMPAALAKHVPTNNATLLADLYGSITQIALYPENDPIRMGAIVAYQDVMFKLVLGALIVAILPPIFCVIFTKDIKLTRAQNAVDAKDLSGEPTEEPVAYGERPIAAETGLQTSQRI
ncbi:uncharacterized protein IL334_000948 [Kwoniella shivajii]|uniref:Major facilitator superfamily (MFS) profile domain-containing protein n=1 Tax=Kwoniella shivajii TaxID=564305 RepID=A0ABZ1CQT3_9TREE|nr:hypothetical protein IL334_000948 [Kwoniella shivajii]